mmetsp:Transcript_51913/g.113825  ORF Transcript_51913/g.113825 Transcript_51913/m.113825 type:complete len:256 (-) Transcript_51913:180-947(-)
MGTGQQALGLGRMHIKPDTHGVGLTGLAASLRRRAEHWLGGRHGLAVAIAEAARANASHAALGVAQVLGRGGRQLAHLDVSSIIIVRPLRTTRVLVLHKSRPVLRRRPSVEIHHLPSVSPPRVRAIIPNIRKRPRRHNQLALPPRAAPRHSQVHPAEGLRPGSAVRDDNIGVGQGGDAVVCGCGVVPQLAPAEHVRSAVANGDGGGVGGCGAGGKQTHVLTEVNGNGGGGWVGLGEEDARVSGVVHVRGGQTTSN